MANASEYEATRAIEILERAIEAARNGNQNGENAVVLAAAAISAPSTFAALDRRVVTLGAGAQ